MGACKGSALLSSIFFFVFFLVFDRCTPFVRPVMCSFLSLLTVHSLVQSRVAHFANLPVSLLLQGLKQHRRDGSRPRLQFHRIDTATQTVFRKTQRCQDKG